jgi:hypothetical protein
MEPKQNLFESRMTTSWGYDRKDYGDLNSHPDGEGNEGDRSEISCRSKFDPPEELPTASDLIGDSATTRHYDVNGLADPSASQKPIQPSKFNFDDSDFNPPPKPTRDVGWMMEQMGLE